MIELRNSSVAQFEFENIIGNAANNDETDANDFTTNDDGMDDIDTNDSSVIRDFILLATIVIFFLAVCEDIRDHVCEYIARILFK